MIFKYMYVQTITALNYKFNNRNGIFNLYFNMYLSNMKSPICGLYSRDEPYIFSMENLSFSLKLLSCHFCGQSFIKTVRGPFKHCNFTVEKISNLTEDMACSLKLVSIFFSFTQTDRPRDYKTFFMLNSTEHEIYHAHKCSNANNCWHFNIYKHDKYKI